MEVQLYVYDLTRGMARTMSDSLLGIHIDAVYHTSLVFNNVEYFFGRGIQTTYPGSTHHGRPMEIAPLGTTHLPMDTILEYLDSLQEIYSPESYDLFAHNCNNFTNDFAMFLVGKGIPDHITNLPRRILDTPLGQMFKSQIDSSMREITQAPTLPASRAQSRTTNGAAAAVSSQTSLPNVKTASNTSSLQKSPAFGKVVNVSDRVILDKHLESASQTVATIFFTSSVCAPCKMAYPMFDRLAEEHSQALFIKVDIDNARELAASYQIRATPTFMTFSKGARQDVWSGADPNLLKANVERVIQQTFPPHPHTLLRVPTLQFGSLKPVTYTKIPPLDKLMAKLGDASRESEMAALRSFVQQRGADPKEATLPKDLPAVANAFQKKIIQLPVDVRFAAVDLLRCAFVDPRIGGYFAEEKEKQTIPSLIKHVNELENCPHNLRLVTIHLACNVFLSPLYVKELMQPSNNLAPLLVQLITSSLLDASHPTTRVAAACLAFNLAATNYRIRREEEREGLVEDSQVELAAGLLETLSSEDNGDAAKSLLLAFGYLVYFAPTEGELMDLVKALDAKSIVNAVKGQGILAKEVSTLV